MGKEDNLSAQLQSKAAESLPLLSGGQQHAIEKFASIIGNYIDQPVTIRFMEAVGGAGKSELINSLRSMLASMGVSVIPDETPPNEYRAQSGHEGPIVATGRIFGTHSPEDITIKVAGFSVDELDRLLIPFVANRTKRRDIARYSMGSFRIAQTIAEYARGITAARNIQNEYYSRIAASFLNDRIPDYMLKKGLPFIKNLLDQMFDQYIPDKNLADEKLLITYELEELSHEGFAHLDGLLAKLGSDLSTPNSSMNPVETIITEMQHGGTRNSYPVEFRNITDLIEQVRKAQQLNSQAALSENLISLPLFTFHSSKQALRDVIIGSIDGVEGLQSEPRFRIVAAIPHDGIERITLEKCLDNCERYPLQSSMRKTAFAIFPHQQRDEIRLSEWNISNERQFFERTSYGTENHNFFYPEFKSMEGLLGLVTNNPDRLFYLSGDHSKIPMVPTIITDLVLESILQQLGYPYIVQYIDKPFLYRPESHELEAL